MPTLLRDLFLQRLILCLRNAGRIGQETLALERVNLQITLRFLNDTENLMIVMNLLCSPYQSIQLDAFDMFKV